MHCKIYISPSNIPSQSCPLGRNNLVQNHAKTPSQAYFYKEPSWSSSSPPNYGLIVSMAGATRFFFCHQTEFSILSNCLHFAVELLAAVWPALSHPWHPRGNLLTSTSSFAQENEMLERSFMSMRWTREMFAGKMWNSGKKFNNTLLDKYHDIGCIYVVFQ